MVLKIRKYQFSVTYRSCLPPLDSDVIVSVIAGANVVTALVGNIVLSVSAAVETLAVDSSLIFVFNVVVFLVTTGIGDVIIFV